MPPEAKPVISSIAEMTCENCVYSNKHWQEDTVKCRKELDSELGDFAKISNSKFFCSHGKWLTSTHIYPNDVAEYTAPWVMDYDDCYYMFGNKK